jgi:hypothetical protein
MLGKSSWGSEVDEQSGGDGQNVKDEASRTDSRDN